MGSRAVLMLVAAAGCGRVGFDASWRDAGPGDAPDGGTTCGARIGAGREHVTIVNAGQLAVWGYGAYGQIGDGQMVDRAVPTPITLAGPVAFAAGGRYETCAALATGDVWCWGEGTSGQLGDGNTVTSASPVRVANLTNASEVATGAVHACARTGGTIACWGDGNSGRLGDGNGTSSPVPVQVAGITTATTIAAGGSTTCAILADDTLRCWGYNEQGGVGVGTTTDVRSPVEPIGLGAVRSVAPRDRSTCAVRMDGAVLCWGANDLGQCGTGASGASVLEPAPVLVGTTGAAALVGADEVGQGIDFGCARLGTEVWCWGQNASGQLGTGVIDGGHPYASRVVGLPAVVQIDVAAWTTCALDTTGAVWCWGDGTHGELADSTTMTTSATPHRSFVACP